MRGLGGKAGRRDVSGVRWRDFQTHGIPRGMRCVANKVRRNDSRACWNDSAMSGENSRELRAAAPRWTADFQHTLGGFLRTEESFRRTWEEAPCAGGQAQRVEEKTRVHLRGMLRIERIVETPRKRVYSATTVGKLEGRALSRR